MAKKALQVPDNQLALIPLVPELPKKQKRASLCGFSHSLGPAAEILNAM